jgi:hypothetical protein
MSTSLTTAEKTEIIKQHIKTLEYAVYHAELDLIEANAVSAPDEKFISATNDRLNNLNAKIDALEAEKEALN